MLIIIIDVTDQRRLAASGIIRSTFIKFQPTMLPSVPLFLSMSLSLSMSLPRSLCLILYLRPTLCLSISPLFFSLSRLREHFFCHDFFMHAQRRQSGLKSGVVDPGKKLQFFQANSRKISIFTGKNFRMTFLVIYSKMSVYPDKNFPFTAKF